MIHIQSLCKSYDRIEVLHDLSFNVNKGEIVGILGANGAGKTTLLRILAGYLSATSGSVTIDGLDLFKDSLEIRRRLGYLPEHIPLYPEMRVGEYIRYRAALKGVPARRIEEKVIDILDLCNLRSVEKFLIRTLSKGYWQRVGLADALVNEPDFLILDEPTIGLDPNQLRKIRDLIKGLSKRHTVLLSTHLLEEVEMLCHRVIILHHGRMIAIGTPDELKKQTNMSLFEEAFKALTHREEV
ncbi:MAG: ABC transporter ATP-binding protein [Chthoniobacterales bacterium]